MTFIASVIAKEGVAIVADSFRTTIEYSLDEDIFAEYLKNSNNKTEIPVADLVKLFEEKASHTRNYVDKLIKFDNDSAVSSAGAAYINGKEIKDVIKGISDEMQKDKEAYKKLSIDEKLKIFCEKVKNEVEDHCKKMSFSGTDFIFSHFNRSENKPQVFIIKLNKTDKDPQPNPSISFDEQTHLKVIADGQDTIVDRLIFGSLYIHMNKVKSEFLEYIIKKLNPEQTIVDELTKEIKDFDFLREMVKNDVFSIKFRELSIQEAVDLACLLIKIVMDIQIYTEKIPTVGGVIRLAVITKQDGFQWISGDKIIPPKLI